MFNHGWHPDFLPSGSAHRGNGKVGGGSAGAAAGRAGGSGVEVASWNLGRQQESQRSPSASWRSVGYRESLDYSYSSSSSRGGGQSGGISSSQGQRQDEGAECGRRQPDESRYSARSVQHQQDVDTRNHQQLTQRERSARRCDGAGEHDRPVEEEGHCPDQRRHTWMQTAGQRQTQTRRDYHQEHWRSAGGGHDGRGLTQLGEPRKEGWHALGREQGEHAVSGQRNRWHQQQQPGRWVLHEDRGPQVGPISRSEQPRQWATHEDRRPQRVGPTSDGTADLQMSVQGWRKWKHLCRGWLGAAAGRGPQIAPPVEEDSRLGRGQRPSLGSGRKALQQYDAWAGGGAPAFYPNAPPPTPARALCAVGQGPRCPWGGERAAERPRAGSGRGGFKKYGGVPFRSWVDEQDNPVLVWATVRGDGCRPPIADLPAMLMACRGDFEMKKDGAKNMLNFAALDVRNYARAQEPSPWGQQQQVGDVEHTLAARVEATFALIMFVATYITDGSTPVGHSALRRLKEWEDELATVAHEVRTYWARNRKTVELARFQEGFVQEFNHDLATISDNTWQLSRSLKATSEYYPTAAYVPRLPPLEFAATRKWLKVATLQLLRIGTGHGREGRDECGGGGGTRRGGGIAAAGGAGTAAAAGATRAPPRATGEEDRAFFDATNKRRLPEYAAAPLDARAGGRSEGRHAGPATSRRRLSSTSPRRRTAPSWAVVGGEGRGGSDDEVELIKEVGIDEQLVQRQKNNVVVDLT